MMAWCVVARPFCDCIEPNCCASQVDYVKFLKKHSEANKDDDAESSAMVTNLYSNYEYMKEIFTRWDVDKSGSVCQLLSSVSLHLLPLFDTSFYTLILSAAHWLLTQPGHLL